MLWRCERREREGRLERERAVRREHAGRRERERAGRRGSGVKVWRLKV